MQRKINFHLHAENKEAFLTILEISETNPNTDDDEPMASRLLESVISFNGIRHDQEEEAYALIANYMREQPKEIKQVDKSYPFTKYSLVETTYVLPLDIKGAFEFIGGVDGFLSNMIYRAKKNEELIDISFDAITSEAGDLNTYCHHAFHVRKPNNNVLPEKPLSRRIAEFLQAEAVKVVKAYAELLAVNDTSLSYPIRTLLYPDITPIEFISKMNVTDPLYKEMLDPDVSYVGVTQKLISKLRTMLVDITPRPKDGELTADQIASNKTIKQAVDDYINDFGKLSKSYWITKIETLYGIDAVDGGKYGSNYTEVVLLMEAEFKVNDAGLMELVYKRNDEVDENKMTAYDRHYAVGKDNHLILEEELRLACQHLGLQFLPNIDFHKGAVFDQPSSIKLFNLRLHFSVDYLKSMMRAMHDAHHTQKDTVIPQDVKLLFFKAIDSRLQATELASVAQITRKL